MLISGVLKFDAGGRVIIAPLSPVVAFNGGTPISDTGALSGSVLDPSLYLASLGYRTGGSICAREAPASGNDQGGLARDSVGALALALVEPIVGYIAGIPIVADGRMAVTFESPPPVVGGFDVGFDQAAFF